jgi:hypothetical protein
MDFKKYDGGVDRFDLAQDRDERRARVNCYIPKMREISYYTRCYLLLKKGSVHGISKKKSYFHKSL